ncbi:hypothetical protein NO1_1872, partial [Candidatus Termititenax aidoneus]
MYVLKLGNKPKGGIYMTRTLYAEVKSGERLVATDITDLTFFPKGTILTFSSEAYNTTSAAFKTIWKICDGTNNTPNLVGRFLRGGSSSDFTTGGGADSRNVTITSANLPAHTHGVGTLAMSALSATELPVSGLTASGLSISGQSISGLSISDLSVDSSGAHTHSGAGTTNAGSGGHTHSVSGSTNSTSKDLTGEFNPSNYQSNTNATDVFTSWENQSREGTDSSSGVRIKMDVNHSHGITGSTSENGGTHAHDVNVSIPEGGSHSHTISGGTISGGTIGGSITGGTVSGSISA